MSVFPISLTADMKSRGEKKTRSQFSAAGTKKRNKKENKKEELPFGLCLLPIIFENGASPALLKLASLGGTTLLTCVVAPWFPYLVTMMFPNLGGWDEKFRVSWTPEGIHSLFGALGWNQCATCLALTVVAFLILFAADCVGVRWPRSWPAQSSCYTEMFTEPRFPR